MSTVLVTLLVIFNGVKLNAQQLKIQDFTLTNLQEITNIKRFHLGTFVNRVDTISFFLSIFLPILDHYSITFNLLNWFFDH